MFFILAKPSPILSFTTPTPLGHATATEAWCRSTQAPRARETTRSATPCSSATTRQPTPTPTFRWLVCRTIMLSERLLCSCGCFSCFDSLHCFAWFLCPFCCVCFAGCQYDRPAHLPSKPCPFPSTHLSPLPCPGHVSFPPGHTLLHRCATPRRLWSMRHPPPRSARTSCSTSSRGASTRRRPWVSVGDGNMNAECG